MNSEPLTYKRTPGLRRVIREVFPDFEVKEAINLLEMGLLRIPKNLRCGAYARSTGKACKAQALPGTWRCKNHGGAAKSEQGRQNIIEGQKRRRAREQAERQRRELEGREP